MEDSILKVRLKIPKRFVSSPQPNCYPSPWGSENQDVTMNDINKSNFNQIYNKDEVLVQKNDTLMQHSISVPNLNLQSCVADDVEAALDPERSFRGSGVVCAKTLEEMRKLRRQQSNRESAKRSRERKQLERMQLEAMIEEKEGEICKWTKKLRHKSTKCFEVSQENQMLEEELVEMYGPAALAGLINPEHQTNANCSTELAICNESSTLEAHESPSRN